MQNYPVDKKFYLTLLCFQVLSDPRVFADYSLMINFIEKENKEMNLGIYRVVQIMGICTAIDTCGILQYLLAYGNINIPGFS